MNHKIASVVLSYNSANDLMAIIPQLKAQIEIQHFIIIVDNFSPIGCRDRISAWVSKNYPFAIIGSFEFVVNSIEITTRNNGCHGGVYCVFNTENRGYSAGNNVGIKVASLLGVDGVLIANPDMRIFSELYIKKLSETLFESDQNMIAASRILNLKKQDQNPLRESRFVEELFWPFLKIRHRFFRKNLVVRILGDKVCVVEKVSGCCMMLRLDFLIKTGLLDENVFLYCEEPILTSKVRDQKGEIVFNPNIVAVHAHESPKNKRNYKSTLAFVRSRVYYIKRYSNYNLIQKTMLHGSLLSMALLYKAKDVWGLVYNKDRTSG